jgi:hypothetical protein
MTFYRVMVDISMRDLLVEADSEKHAEERIRKEYVYPLWREHPFGGRPSQWGTRIRKPWKKQLKGLIK